MSKITVKIPVGISSCLLGQHVRYDGGHKSNDYIRQSLGEYFDFKYYCPEVESGMSIPRPPVQLRQMGSEIRCVGVKDHKLDVTEQLTDSFEHQREWLTHLCGYILKKDSPSCGLFRVKIYDQHNYAHRNGTGLFAKFLSDNFPMLPMEEEGRLCDPHLRENFIQRVYVMHRWQTLISKPLSVSNLTQFHSQHKLILMSHDQQKTRELGQLAARANSTNLNKVAEQYGHDMMTCLTIIASRGNHVNVLQHIQGYLKKKLESIDKRELSETIEKYREGVLPLIVPITLLKHHFRRQPDPFIEQSYYMSPYPIELKTLNDI